jgi:hypothetical protein
MGAKPTPPDRSFNFRGCEGFRMPVGRVGSTRCAAGVPKASREGNRGPVTWTRPAGGALRSHAASPLPPPTRGEDGGKLCHLSGKKGS